MVPPKSEVAKTIFTKQNKKLHLFDTLEQQTKSLDYAVGVSLSLSFGWSGHVPASF